MTKTVETTTAPVAKRRGVQISVTVPAETFDGLTDHKWTSRVEVKDQLLEAISDYVAKHEIKIDGSAPKV